MIDIHLSNPGARKRGGVSVTIGAFLVAMALLNPAVSRAMARLPVHFPPASGEGVETDPIPRDTGSGESGEQVSAGRFEEGYRLGSQTAGALVANIREKTLRREGCAALPKFEAALVAVVRSLKAPAPGAGDLSTDSVAQDPLVRGYFRGYLDRIRTGDREGRESCAVAVHESGRFAGDLYGGYLCRSGDVSLEWVKEMDLEPLYDGWSGGSSAVFGECEEGLLEQLRNCGFGDYAGIWGRVIESSCWTG